MESEHDIFWRGNAIYFRGRRIAFLMDTIREEFEIEGEAEISIECNPGTVDEKKLKSCIGRQESTESVLGFSPNKK